MRKKLTQERGSASVSEAVDAAHDDAGCVPDIGESDVSPQEYTRQLDLALVAEIAQRFPGDSVSAFVRAVEKEFASYSEGDTREAVRLSTYHTWRRGLSGKPSSCRL